MSGPVTVASVNVNGVRAAVRRGMGGWLDQRRPDVLCLQEVRAPDEVLRECLGPGWSVAHGGPSSVADRGRAGVAVAVRSTAEDASGGWELAQVRDDVGDPRFAGAGRWVEADLVRRGDGTALTIASAYVHKGDTDGPRQADKHAFLDAVAARLGSLRATGREVLACGDLNIAHREADLKNWRANRDHAGFLPQERAALDRLFGELGWVDVVRSVHPGAAGPYSWWSWRGRAFDTDAGWRIDYQVATPGLAASAVSAEVDRAPSYAKRFSDHAPVVVRYAWAG